MGKDGLGLLQTPAIREFVAVVRLAVEVHASVEEGRLILPFSGRRLNFTTIHLHLRLNSLPATDFLRKKKLISKSGLVTRPLGMG